MLSLGNLPDFHRRTSQSQLRPNDELFLAEPGGRIIQVHAVAFHFLGFGEGELVEATRGPAVGDVQQQELGAEFFGQFHDVRQEAFVRRAIFEGD
jgi:hypothetical protein